MIFRRDRWHIVVTDAFAFRSRDHWSIAIGYSTSFSCTVPIQLKHGTQNEYHTGSRCEVIRFRLPGSFYGHSE